MRRRRSGIERGLLPALATLALCGSLWSCGGEPAGLVGIGSRAPAFDLPALEGGSLSSETLEGRPVILNFWATWCQPCRREFPILNALHRDSRVEVVTISLDEEGPQKVASFVERQGLEYKVLLGDQETFERFGGFTIPYTLVLDPEQVIVGVYRGPASEESLQSDLRRIYADETQEAAEEAAGV